MSEHKNAKRLSLVKDIAADYLVRNASGPALVTVTGVEETADNKKIRILLSVLPTEFEDTIVGFSKRHTRDFQEFLGKKARMRAIPSIEFVIDRGEKNRQRIDELLHGEENRDTTK